jgi:hypothetical protein
VGTWIKGAHGPCSIMVICPKMHKMGTSIHIGDVYNLLLYMADET